jgi:hypothetical protein
MTEGVVLLSCGDVGPIHEPMAPTNPFQLRSTTTVLPSNRIIIGRIRRRLLKV